MKKNKILVILICIMLLLTACMPTDKIENLTNFLASSTKPAENISTGTVSESDLNPPEITEPEETEPTVPETTIAPKPEPQRVSFMATGDIMYHKEQYVCARTDTGYDFSDNFYHMKSRLDAVDFVVGNFETTCDPLDEPRSYPMFNVPIEAVEQLAADGFSVLSTINNHSLDSRIQGIEKTLDSLAKNGISTFGTYKNPDRTKLIKDFNGIKIAFLSYTQYFNGLEVWLDDSNSYMVSPLDESLIKSEIEEVLALGADFVIVYPHWGIEYATQPNEEQIELAHKMIDWGADCVLGSHPHVLQKTEWVEHNGEAKFVIYSMGNTISGQRRESLGRNDGDTETGVFLKFELEKAEDGVTRIVGFQAIPTWVDRYYDANDKVVYAVTAVEDYFDGGPLAEQIQRVGQEKMENIRDRAIERLEIEPIP